MGVPTRNLDMIAAIRRDAAKWLAARSCFRKSRCRGIRSLAAVRGGICRAVCDQAVRGIQGRTGGAVSGMIVEVVRL
jgi:hypothetical protein